MYDPMLITMNQRAKSSVKSKPYILTFPRRLIKKSPCELYYKGARLMGITEIIPTLIANASKEADLSSVIGVGFIFTYLTIIVVTALIRIKQGKHMDH